jgi:hypothetical protein
MTKARDSQRSKVYRSENEAEMKVFLGRDPEIMTLEEIEGMITNIQVSEWFRVRYGRPRWFRVYPSPGCGKARCFQMQGGGFEITIPKKMRRRWIVLHELSHGLTPRNFAWHGPEFCGNYLSLCKEYLPEGHYNTLLECFQKNGVRWLPRSRATTNFFPFFVATESTLGKQSLPGSLQLPGSCK